MQLDRRVTRLSNTRIVMVALFCAWVSLEVCAQSSSAESRPTFTISIKAAQSTVQFGKPIDVQLTLKNISDHRLSLPQDMYHAGLDNQVTVRDLQDKEQPKS